MSTYELLLFALCALLGCAIAPNFRHGLWLIVRPLPRLLHVAAYLLVFGPPALLVAAWFRMTRPAWLYQADMEAFFERRFLPAVELFAPKGW